MEKINVANLLRNCPSGMELDCTINYDVKFIKISQSSAYPIILRTKNGYEITLTKYGQVHNMDDSKCVIFPKGKTSWEGFVPPCQFKDGDVVVAEDNESFQLFLLKHLTRSEDYNTHDGYCYFGWNFQHNELFEKGIWGFNRLATEEEKQKLFDTIKANGYKWNPGTKTLEELPKFKVGDTITNGKTSITIGYIDNEYYYEISRNIATRLFIKHQNEWELISSKFPNKFNINTLVPFESRVLVRDYNNDRWKVSFWGCLMDSEYGFKYDTVRGCYRQCIPYEGNEYLLGKTDDCDKYFKSWE